MLVFFVVIFRVQICFAFVRFVRCFSLTRNLFSCSPRRAGFLATAPQHFLWLATTPNICPTPIISCVGSTKACNWVTSTALSKQSLRASYALPSAAFMGQTYRSFSAYRAGQKAAGCSKLRAQFLPCNIMTGDIFTSPRLWAPGLRRTSLQTSSGTTSASDNWPWLGTKTTILLF